MKGKINQDQRPNFRKDGKLFLVRCFACGDKEQGRENWAPAVASGQCAWCGWKEENPPPRKDTMNPKQNNLLEER